MPKVVACLVVRTERAFKFLGHMPVMNWMLTQLKDVRGVDRLVCVAAPKLAEQAKRMLAAEEIETVVMPPEVLRGDAKILDQWLISVKGPAAEADVVSVLTPTTPFLPAGKIEACIVAVRRRFADIACTTLTSPAFTESGKMQAHVEQAGCRTFAPGRISGFQFGRFRPIEVSKLEALDVSEPDESRLATALVSMQ